jgi:hypothetical protein
MKYITDGKRHLICIPYSIDNLHIMASDLDIARHWFHSGSKPHYDIPKKRIKEIEAKCIIVTSKDLVHIINKSIKLSA